MGRRFAGDMPDYRANRQWEQREQLPVAPWGSHRHVEANFMDIEQANAPLGRAAVSSRELAGFAPQPNAVKRLRQDRAFDLDQEIRALELLKQSAAAHDQATDDPDLMLMLAEGETSLLETLDVMLRADLNDDALIEGLKSAKEVLIARLHRLEERRRSRRSLIEQALFALELRRLERPLATLSLVERAPSLIVEDEAQVPAAFFDLQPVLNRRLAKQRLEDGQAIPGARLSQAVVTLTVRRR